MHYTDVGLVAMDFILKTTGCRASLVPQSTSKILNTYYQSIEEALRFKENDLWCFSGGFAIYALGYTSNFEDIDFFFFSSETPQDYGFILNKFLSSRGVIIDLVKIQSTSKDILEFVVKVISDFDLDQCRCALFVIDGRWHYICMRNSGLTRRPLTLKSALREERYFHRSKDVKQNPVRLYDAAFAQTVMIVMKTRSENSHTTME